MIHETVKKLSKNLKQGQYHIDEQKSIYLTGKELGYNLNDDPEEVEHNLLAAALKSYKNLI